MNEKTSQSESLRVSDAGLPADQMPATALARRRLLLKGASGGAATLAALTPLGALATTQSTVFVCKNGDNKDVLCTLSGVQSAAHSFSATITKVSCGGKKVSHWNACTTSAPTTPSNPWPTGCNSSAKVSTVFGINCEYANTAMFTVVKQSTLPMAHWITAYLNATKFPASFPYTPAQVVSLYADTTKRAAALAFFTGYLENLA